MQNRITADIAAFRLPRYAQIPEVGLYLEQVVRYINARLAPLGEPELTGSMVSNYVKQKLVPAPQKKLYTAEHLARLLFIAVVKPVVPLEEILGIRLGFTKSLHGRSDTRRCAEHILKLITKIVIRGRKGIVVPLYTEHHSKPFQRDNGLDYGDEQEP